MKESPYTKEIWGAVEGFFLNIFNIPITLTKPVYSLEHVTHAVCRSWKPVDICHKTLYRHL